VKIYLESECKFSKIFVQQQIKENYDKIKSFAQLTFIPFGKSRSVLKNNKIEFVCQHGEYECRGNMQMACVLNFLQSELDEQAKFMICAMGYEKTKIHCAEEVGVKEEQLESCMKNEGVDLQLENEKKTNPIIEKSRHIPSIVIDGNYSTEIDYAAMKDFLGTLKEK
jgi:hypothetical protein